MKQKIDKGIVAILIVIALVLVLVNAIYLGNTFLGKVVDEENKEVVKVGVLMPLSGARAEAGQYVSEGIDLAQREINSNIWNKYEIKLIYQDTQYNPQEATKGFYHLKDVENVDFIVGAYSSSTTLAVTPLAEGSQKILITPGSQASEISQAGDYIFRTQTNVKQEAPFFARYVNSVIGNEKLHVIGIDTAYAPSFMNSFDSNIGIYEKHEVGETDFRDILLKIKSEDPKYIMVVSGGKYSGNILKQAYEMGINVQWFAPSPLEGKDFLTTAKHVAEGIIYPYPYNSESQNEKMKEFREKYFKVYNKENEMLSANAYDTLYLLSNCFEDVGTNVDDVKRCLYGVKNYAGASGTFSIDENGDVVKDFVLKTVKDGEFVKY